MPPASLAAPPSLYRDVRKPSSPPSEPARRNGGASRPHPVARPVRDLKHDVLAALCHSGYTALSLVGCDVDRDRVILSGSVPSYHMKQLAQVFALRVEGVDRIDNRLEVHERPKR